MVVILYLVGCLGEARLDGIAIDGKVYSKDEWQPGDDIPGWEVYDYDCPLRVGADAAVADFSTVWESRLILHGHDISVGIYTNTFVTLAYCDEDLCGDSSPNAPDIFAEAIDSDATDLWDKTGFFGQPSDRPSSVVVSTGQLNIGSYTTDSPPGVVSVSMCLSRSRPDELAGIVYVTYIDQTLPHRHYEEALVQYPFESFYPDHGGIDSTAFEGRVSFNADDLTKHYIAYAGDAGYDVAWDWDAITDPEVRETVYDRYYPYWTYVTR